MLFSFKKFSVEFLIFRNFWKKTVPTVPRQFRQYRNVKPYQVGTGTEKPYRVSTKLVLELKNRTKTVPTVPVRFFGTGTNLHVSHYES